jgi:hypothetical protein
MWMVLWGLCHESHGLPWSPSDKGRSGIEVISIEMSIHSGLDAKVRIAETGSSDFE